jgi:hypothetical protein
LAEVGRSRQTRIRKAGWQAYRQTDGQVDRQTDRQ